MKVLSATQGGPDFVLWAELPIENIIAEERHDETFAFCEGHSG